MYTAGSQYVYMGICEYMYMKLMRLFLACEVGLTEVEVVLGKTYLLKLEREK